MHTSEVPRMYHKEVQPSTAELRRTIIIHGFHGSNFEQSKKVQWPSRCRFKISTYGFPTQRNRTPNFDSKNIEDIIVGGVVWMSNFWWLQLHLQSYKWSILNLPSGNETWQWKITRFVDHVPIACSFYWGISWVFPLPCFITWLVISGASSPSLSMRRASTSPNCLQRSLAAIVAAT